MKKGFVILIIGFILLVISIKPVYLMSQEVLIGKKVESNYKIENVYQPMDMISEPFNTLRYLENGNMKSFKEMRREVFLNNDKISNYNDFENKIKIGEENHLSVILHYYESKIKVENTFIGTNNPEDRERSVVQIIINDKNYAETVKIRVRPTHLDNNRYHGYLGIIKLTDLSNKEESLNIIQRVSDSKNIPSENELKWNLISISENGDVNKVVFDRTEIDNPAFRKDLVNKSSTLPYSLGYKSNVLTYYPSIFYPFIYPFSIFILGLILSTLSMIYIRRNKKRKN